MMLSIKFAERYTNAETFRMVASQFFLGLTLSGLEYMYYRTPNGVQYDEIPYNANFLTFFPKGTYIDFKYNQKRENWVIGCDSELVKVLADKPLTIYNYNNSEIYLPYIKLLLPEDAIALREKFVIVKNLWQSSMPEEQFKAELLATSLIVELLHNSPKQKDTSRAAQLRELIDRDIHFEFKLVDFAKKIGISNNCIRNEFSEKFQITPKEYQNRRRLARIITLMAQTKLSIKEIAADVGMNHVTHLYLFLRENCHMTASKLLNIHRGEIIAEADLLEIVEKTNGTKY